ncbi:MAG: hypothetical protein ASARMPREDX12_000273 [Alectoria sarmentosa]|nr:MAG: hypothetical protein ASARMPREDX12_000273 [Alectoria sarmentosa]
MARRRILHPIPSTSAAMETEAEPLIPEAVNPTHPEDASPPKTTATIGKLPWIPLAAASGACAAFNGVFAKLTTTELTSSWAAGISTAVGLSSTNKIVELLIRAFFFSLNLAFNALMWALFTSALTRASSTTRVSIINTSANFMLTAFSGWMVFVIGRRDEEADVTFKGKVGGEGGRGEQEGEEQRREGYRDREGEEDVDGGGGEGAISDGVELDEAKVKK